MTALPQAAVDAAVHNIRAVRELIAAYQATFEVCAQRPEGVIVSAELCAQNAKTLSTWTTILDCAVDALVPVPVPTAAPPPPPAPRPRPRLAAKDGEAL